MDSLRRQLAETQQHLTDRDTTYRSLKVSYRGEKEEWTKEQALLQERIALLEKENAQLRQRNGVAVEKNKTPRQDPVVLSPPIESSDLKERMVAGLVCKLMDEERRNGGGDMKKNDLVTIPRHIVERAEEKYLKMSVKLFEMWRLIQPSLFPNLSSVDTLGSVPAADKITASWEALQLQIYKFTTEYLCNKTIEVSGLPSQVTTELKLLSLHWKSYISTKENTPYILCALIWRYIYRNFEVFCRAYGREVGEMATAMGRTIAKTIPNAHAECLRMLVANMIHESYPIDESLLLDRTNSLLSTLEPFMESSVVGTGAASRTIRKTAEEIVRNSAELSTVIYRSHYQTVMSDGPEGTLRHGFPYSGSWMDMKTKLGKGDTVDLMITPALVEKPWGPEEKKGDYSVLVKAQVVC
ncbi:hypothetical protein GGS20DRAFT_137952 [Poronia punctata]|nr:hypothetical protein GGS20DRAFT_137952 [Poronia punctata]